MCVSVCANISSNPCVFVWLPAFLCVCVCLPARVCRCPLTFQWPTWAMQGVWLQLASYKSQRQTLDSYVRKMACSCWNVGALTSNYISLSATQPTNALGGTHTNIDAQAQGVPEVENDSFHRTQSNVVKRHSCAHPVAQEPMVSLWLMMWPIKSSYLSSRLGNDLSIWTSLITSVYCCQENWHYSK